VKLLAVGLNYRSASPELLARATAGTTDIAAVLDELLGSFDIAEAMVVSTCNRVEMYTAVRGFHGALNDVGTVLARQCGVPLTQLAPGLYAHYADEAVRQLFKVASGLDSLVQGERQVLGQLRAAYITATKHGAVGSVLHEATQQALRVGKRIHTEVMSSEPQPSIAEAALNLGESHLGSLVGASALVVGAGDMGTAAAAALRGRGVDELRILSRSRESAARLAATLCASHGILAELDQALLGVDVVVCATSSPQYVLTPELATARLAQQRRLLIVDLAMPKDVAPLLAEIPGVRVIDLPGMARAVTAMPEATLSSAWRILSEEMAAFSAADRATSVTPIIVALRERAEDLMARELAWLTARQPQLEVAQQADVARAMRRLTKSLLHDPTVRVKQLAAADGSYYADALRELFDLDVPTETAAAAIAAASVGLAEYGRCAEVTR